MTQRTLKIEERGDYHTGQTVPMVRLKGKWLAAAGFPPGQQVSLTVTYPGVIELRVSSPINACQAAESQCRR